MSIAQRVIKNTSFLFGANVINKIMSVILLAYAARVLGVKNLGLYILAITFVSFFGFATQIGIRAFAIREIAKDKSKAEIFLNNILSLRLVLSLVALSILVVTVILLHYPPETQKLIYLIGLTLIFGVFPSSFGMIYMAFERMAIPAAASVFGGVISSSLQILVLYLGYGLQVFILVQVIMAAIFAFVYGCFVWRNLIKFKIQLDFAFWKQLIKSVSPFAVLRFAALVHTKIDILMLSKIAGPIDKNLAVGYYGPPYRIFNTLLIIPRNLRGAMLPMIASHFDSSLGIVRASLEKSTKFLLFFLCFPTLIATTFFAPQMVTLLFGKSYIPSAAVLTILGWIYSFELISAPIIAVLMTSQRHLIKYIPWAVGTALLNIILNFLFIPTNGYIGAAYVTLITTTLAFFIKLYFIKSVLSIKLSEIKHSLKLVVPLCLTWGGIWILSKIGIWLIVIAGVPIYVGMLALFKTFNRKELAMILNIIRRREQSITPPDS